MRRSLPHRLPAALIVLVVLCVSFFVYVRAEKLIDRANDIRSQSVEQADQLRRSSDDLTRMVRTYVVTGDPIYKQAFLDIVAIRDGLKRSPPGYAAIYWDLALLDGHPPKFDEEPGTALLELLRRTGITAEELAKLAEAKGHSDSLTTREYEAMALVEAGGENAEANRARAIAMVHDAGYHQAKAVIMRPINEFYGLMNRRTLADIRDAERMAVVFRFVFLAFTAGAVLLLWRAHSALQSTLGGSADEVHAQMTRIGRGDLAEPASGGLVPPDSVLGSLADMRTKLRAIETAGKRAAGELSDKNAALARSNAELEAFAYVASHDLREPLRNVTAFSTLLARRLDGRLQADEQDLLKILTDAANRMDSLVRDLLEVSRVGRGEAGGFQSVAISEVVATVLGSLRFQTALVGSSVEVGANLPEVLGNREELYRVFLNIIGNSLKYCGPVAPVIRIECLAEGAGFWRFEIRDNGLGFENGLDYEERIFGLFQRLHQRDEHGGGTGIGLTICRKIISHHGGRIWAQSDGLGHGTVIAFTLPRAPGGR